MARTLISFLLFLLLFGYPVQSLCQSGSNGEIRSTCWSGPRIGITYITGKTADRLKDEFDAVPVISQFGWQFERNFFWMENGPTDVVELIPLIGGVEQASFFQASSLPLACEPPKDSNLVQAPIFL